MGVPDPHIPATASPTGTEQLASSLWSSVCPDPFQGPAELPLAQGWCQVPLAQSAADPPNLQTAKGQGEQSQLEGSPVQVFQANCPMATQAQQEGRQGLEANQQQSGADHQYAAGMPNARSNPVLTVSPP